MLKLKTKKIDLTVEELKDFIENEHQRMVKRWHENEKVRTMARTIKLMEEVGELSNEIMAFNVKQRKEKMYPKNIQNLSDELADVIIVTLLLAENVKIDVYPALKNKIKKIEKRWQDSEY